jgi:UPF0176 protein
MLNIHNIAGYKFIPLNHVPELQAAFRDHCKALEIKGTILLSEEGINVSLGASHEAIAVFKLYLQQDERFADMTFRESFSETQPFRRLKVKLKKEIITMGRPEVNPGSAQRAPAVSPTELKQWLDEKKDILILDTRNDYEMQFGTFENAVNLKLNDFGEFPEKAKSIEKDKPVVMFCTGGIRCEKAAIHLMNSGFENVYQLEGGILNYFAEVGAAHYHGECFVFDGRVALNSELQSTGAVQCRVCQGAIKQSEEHHCHSFN